MESNDQSQEMTKEAAAALLGSLTGAWEGTAKTWFEPGVLADTSPIHGRIRQPATASFIIYEYESSVAGEYFTGTAIFGFNIYTKEFEMAWTDSGHQSTNIMFATGHAVKGGISVLGSYKDPSGGPDWGWRTEIIRTGAQELTVTAYNITPDGQEAVGLQSVMVRAGEVD
jgi:hypothetical protein